MSHEKYLTAMLVPFYLGEKQDPVGRMPDWSRLKGDLDGVAKVTCNRSVRTLKI